MSGFGLTTEIHWWKNNTTQYIIIDSFDAVTMPTYGIMHTSDRNRIFSNQPRPASQTHQSFRVSSIVSNRAYPTARSHNFFRISLYLHDLDVCVRVLRLSICLATTYV